MIFVLNLIGAVAVLVLISVGFYVVFEDTIEEILDKRKRRQRNEDDDEWPTYGR